MARHVKLNLSTLGMVYSIVKIRYETQHGVSGVKLIDLKLARVLVRDTPYTLLCFTSRRSPADLPPHPFFIPLTSLAEDSRLKAEG